VKLNRLGRIPRGNSKEKNIFEFQRLLKFWQDFENFYKEISKEFGHKDFS
jgi:hypothetical protein